jgi:hypothetical protein
LGDGKGEDGVARTALDNFEKEWRYYQSLSSYNQRAQRKGIGILRDAKSGKEFYDYVRAQIAQEGNKEVCARNMIRELMKDPKYLVNAVTDRDGRRGLSILVDDWRGEANLRGVIRAAMSKQGKEYAVQYQRIFDQNFQKYSEDFKKEVEKQGQYKVERVYYIRRDVPGEREGFNEIRAEIRQVVAKHETKQGEIEKIFSSQKKDISIGLFDRARGDFVPGDYIHRKDPPLEKTFADWVAEDVLTLGISAIARVTGRVLMKGGEIVAKGVAKKLTTDAIEEGVKKFTSAGEKVVGKGLARGIENAAVKEGAKKFSGRAARADASRSLSEAVTRERVRAKGLSRKVRDTAQDMGDTFDLSKFERNMSAKVSGKTSARTPSPSGRLSTAQPLRARDVYSESMIDFIGKDVAEKAVEIGIDAKHLGTMIWQAEARGMMKKPSWAAEAYEWGYLPEGFFPTVSKATREAVRRDIQATYSLGENMARKLILYGHDPYDISRMIDASAAKGLTATEIRQQFANELKLMNYYREKFHPGLRTLENAKAALTPAHSAPGDAYVNIRSEIFQRLLNKYKRQLDATHGRPSVWDELPEATTSKIFLNLHETADKITQRLVKRILGSTPAVVPLSALRKDRSIEEDKKRIEAAEAEKTKGKRIEAEKTKPEKEWVRAKSTEEKKVEEIENAELKHARAGELWLSELEGAERKGKDRSSEIEKETKREKERREKIRKDTPRSPKEAESRAQEEAAQRRALGVEGLKAIQQEYDAERLAYEKADADGEKAWTDYEEWKKKYMEENKLSSEEDFEESLASDEGAWDVYEDSFKDEEESGDEGSDEGGFGSEDEGGYGGEDEGEDEEAHEDKMEDEEESKARREISGGEGGGGGESG